VPKATIREAMMVDQFALEVRIQAAIDHPNLVAVYAVFDDAQHVYLLVEYLTDGSLYNELRKKGKYEEQEAALRVRALCRAVEALHMRGVAHRDIKPENIMLCGVPYIPLRSPASWATSAGPPSATNAG
jgi:serine/threonine protein kinase